MRATFQHFKSFGLFTCEQLSVYNCSTIYTCHYKGTKVFTAFASNIYSKYVSIVHFILASLHIHLQMHNHYTTTIYIFHKNKILMLMYCHKYHIENHLDHSSLFSFHTFKCIIRGVVAPLFIFILFQERCDFIKFKLYLLFIRK